MKTKVLSTVVFVFFSVYALYAKDTTDTFKVKGGDCIQCKTHIEMAATNVVGVSLANWDSKKQVLRVIFDDAKTNLKMIKKAVAKAGNDTSDIKAKDAEFKKLPDCCKYKRE